MITLTRKKVYRYIVVFVLFGVFAARILTENFGVNYSIMIFFDLVAYMALLMLLKFRITLTSDTKRILFIVALLVIGCIIGMLEQGFTINGLIVGLRRYFRLYVAIALGMGFFTTKRWHKLINYLVGLLYVNAVVMTVQYFIFGLKQDWIGGTFGNTPGCNGIQNVLFCIVTTYYIVLFINRKCKLSKLFFIIGLCIYMSALAELTIYFFELALIVITSVFITSQSARTFLTQKLPLILGMGIACFLGVELYLQVFPERAFLLSLDNILDYIGMTQGTTGVYKISKVHVFSQLGTRFFHNIDSLIFGLGLGNSASGSVFFNSYWDTLHYTETSSAMEFLENGFWGVFVNLSLWVMVFFASLNRQRKSQNINCSMIYEFMGIFSILCFIWFFYNSVLSDIYTSYLIGIVTAGGFIALREENTCDSKENSLHMAGEKQKR